MLRASARDPARHDLSPLRREALQPSGVLPVDGGFLDAELADLSLEESLVPATPALVTSALAPVTAIRAEAAFPAVAASASASAFAPEPARSTITLRSIALWSIALWSITLWSIALWSITLWSIALWSICAGRGAFWCAGRGCLRVLII